MSSDNSQTSPLIQEIEDKSAAVNPLEFHLKLPTWVWIRSILLGIVLIPLRCCILFIITFVIWLLALYLDSRWSLIDVTNNDNVLMTKLMNKLLKLVTWAMGFVVDLRGVRSKEARIIVCAPHTTFFDVPATFAWSDMPVAMIADNYKHVPFLGLILSSS